MSDHINSSSAQKREISVAQLAQSFKSKADFQKYFSTQLQLYTPPSDQMTKEWLKTILAGDKQLIKLSDLKTINVGNFQEVSVKSLWAEFSNRPEIVPYLPVKLPKGKQIDRDYFFNVINTIFPEELKAIIQHAHSQRNSIQLEDQKQEAIMMSAEMADAMFKFPFISKSKGRTVHLLKAKSKSQRIFKPRKTYELLPKEQRNLNSLEKPSRRRPHQDNEDQNMEDAAAPRQRDFKPNDALNQIFKGKK